MKRTLITAMVFAAGAALGAAAYAQGAHDHGRPKSGPGAAHDHGTHEPGSGAAQGHDAHCCKPDPSDMKGMQGMAGHSHDHAQVPQKPAAKQPGRKPAADAGPAAR